MEITIDKHAANEASVKIKLGEADYQQTVDAKIKDYAKKANIKGFRPGKAPFTMVKTFMAHLFWWKRLIPFCQNP